MEKRGQGSQGRQGGQPGSQQRKQGHQPGTQPKNTERERDSELEDDE